MVRISNTLLPTNSAGVPQTELTNTSIAITTAGTLTVSDPVAQSSLSSIVSNTASLSGTLQVSDSAAQSTLTTIATNTGALSSTLAVNDSSANTTLSSIDTALAGTLQVSSSSTISGSNGNLFNASSVSNGSQSSVVVLSTFTKNTVYVSATTGNEVRVLVRGANSGSYIYHSSLYPYDPAGGSSTSAVLKLNDEAIYDIKLEATGTDTITASVFSRA